MSRAYMDIKMTRHDQRIEILKIEYTQTSTKLIYLDDQANKYVGYILTAIGALATFLALFISSGDDFKEYKTISAALFLVATLIVGLLIIVTLHYNVRCIRLGGYIKYLEDELNAIAGQRLLRWESDIAPKYIHKDITSIFIYSIIVAMFFTLVAATLYISIKFVYNVCPVIVFFALFIILLEIAAGVIYLRKSFLEHERIYKLIQKRKHINVKVYKK